MDLIDLPGLYSLTPTSAVEEVSRDFLLQGDWDVLINVVDASQMARSLELTLELLDLEAPMVVCLNMMDEASRKGMAINTLALASALGVPVVEAIGGRGRGIVETFQAAQREAQSGRRPHPYVYAPELESVLDRLTPELESADDPPVLDAPQKTEIVISPAIAVRENLGLPFATSARSTSNEHLPPLCSVKGCSSLCCSGLSGTTGKHGARPQSQGLGLSGRAPHSSSSLLGEAIDRDHGFSLLQSPSKVFPTARFWALHLVQSEPIPVAVRAGVLAAHSANASVALATPDAQTAVDRAQAEILERTGQPADAAISSARHAACLNLFEQVVHVTRPRSDWREKIDHIAMHPLWGYLVLAGVFLGFFRLIFDVGKLGEDRILGVFDLIVALLARHMDPQSALFAAAKGGVLGTAGAVAIVLPYLLPFLVGLAILEDIGYLSRVGYLMDAAMHKLGLHGTATLPVLVGYGCSVPAVMATRILSSRRDRFIAAFLAVLVPCSARMTVIFALVGFYLGANYALGIYVLNIIVVALSGAVLARIWPEVSPGHADGSACVPRSRGKSCHPEDLVAAAGICSGRVSAAGSGKHHPELGGLLRLAASHQRGALAPYGAAGIAAVDRIDTDLRRAAQRAFAPDAHAGSGNHACSGSDDSGTNRDLHPLRDFLPALHGDTCIHDARTRLAADAGRIRRLAGSGHYHQPCGARSFFAFLECRFFKKNNT